MIADLQQADMALDEAQQVSLDMTINALDQRREVARKRLKTVLESKAYRRFIKEYESFLLTPGLGAKSLNGPGISPVELRHVLPPMIYEYLASVRAYDSALDQAEIATLHALRIEFKRLRYAVSLFSEVLGKEVSGFIDEIKVMQDYLGRLNDIDVARHALLKLMDDLEPDQNAVLRIYIDSLVAEEPVLMQAFPKYWQHFNSKPVQRKLANAVLAL
jgi:CHAD domain-containing protein